METPETHTTARSAWWGRFIHEDTRITPVLVAARLPEAARVLAETPLVAAAWIVGMKLSCWARANGAAYKTA